MNEEKGNSNSQRHLLPLERIGARRKNVNKLKNQGRMLARKEIFREKPKPNFLAHDDPSLFFTEKFVTQRCFSSAKMSAISKNAFKETECIFNFVAFEKLVVKHLLVIFQKGILLMLILYKYSPIFREGI